MISGNANSTYLLEVVNVALDYKNMYLPAGTIREGQVRRFSVDVHANGAISAIDNAVDLDRDNDCDIFDIVLMAAAYGTQPGDPGWNMLADIAAPIDKADIFDIVIAASAYDSQGGGVPDLNWFPGADLAPACCVIDVFDIVTVTGKYGQEFDYPP